MSLNRSRNFTPRLSKASLLVSVMVVLVATTQFARITPLVRAAEREEKTQEKVQPAKEKAPQEKEEALPEEDEEVPVVPGERRLTPEQRMELEEAIARERMQRLRELEERQRAEREALTMEEAERRGRPEQRLEAERRYYQQIGELDERRARAYAQNPLFVDEPVLIGVEEEAAIAEAELIELMSEIVRNDSDSKVRAAAIESIGRLGSEAACDALAGLYESIPELDLKKKALSSMSFSRKLTPKVNAKLMEIAKTGADDELRDTALRVLAGVPENEGAEPLISIYDSASSADTKKTVIRYLGHNRSPSAVDKLKAIARKDSDPDLRLEAVRTLGQLRGGLLMAVPDVEPGLLIHPVRPLPRPPVPAKPKK